VLANKEHGEKQQQQQQQQQQEEEEEEEEEQWRLHQRGAATRPAKKDRQESFNRLDVAYRATQSIHKTSGVQAARDSNNQREEDLGRVGSGPAHLCNWLVEDDRLVGWDHVFDVDEGVLPAVFLEQLQSFVHEITDIEPFPLGVVHLIKGLLGLFFKDVQHR